MRAYKFRMYPNRYQEQLLQKTFGCVRFVYNKMLGDKIRYYEKEKKMLNNTPAQYKTEFPFLKEVDSLALANAQLNLQKALKSFFVSKGKSGFPVFKSKHFSKKSYTTNRNKKSNNIDVFCRHVKLPKLGKVKTIIHRETPSVEFLKSATISQTSSGKYFVSLLFDVDFSCKNVVPESAIGLDFSMPKLFVDSNGNSAEYPRYYRKEEKKLAKQQRCLSRKQKGSNRYRKQKRKIAITHEKIANQRKDFLHKVSHAISKMYDLVSIESLNMQSMSKSLNLGKSVHDVGFGMFVQFLEYKLNEQGRTLVKIDKWYPSSKTCSLCGKQKKNLSLSDRMYSCDCGNVIDRDVNAAINILRQGILDYQAAGHAVSAQVSCDHKVARLRSPHLKASA